MSQVPAPPAPGPAPPPAAAAPAALRHLCPGCLAAPGTLRCGGCLRVWYCGKACQKLHWKGRGRSAAPTGQTEPPHKTWCVKPAAAAELGVGLVQMIAASPAQALEALQDMRLNNSEEVYDCAEAAGLNEALVANLKAEVLLLRAGQGGGLQSSILQAVLNCLFACRRVLVHVDGGGGDGSGGAAVPFYVRQGNAATDPARVLRLLTQPDAWLTWLAVVSANLTAYYAVQSAPEPAAFLQDGRMHPSRQTLVPRDLLVGTVYAPAHEPVAAQVLSESLGKPTWEAIGQMLRTVEDGSDQHDPGGALKGIGFPGHPKSTLTAWVLCELFAD